MKSVYKIASMAESDLSPTNNQSILRALTSTASFVRNGVPSRSRKWESNPEKIKGTLFNEFEAGYRISRVPVGHGRVNNIVLSVDETYAYLSHLTDIMMFEIESRSVSIVVKDAHSANIEDLLIVPSKNMLISCAADNSIKLWDLSEKKLIYALIGAHDGIVTCLALTSDEGYLVSGSYDSSIKIWDLMEVKCIGTIPNAHKEHIYTVAVTKDSSRIISGGLDKSIEIWDFKTLERVHQFKYAHIGIILSFQLSEDSNTLFSSCADGQIKAWDLKKLEMTHKFPTAHANGIGDLKLIGKSRFILSVSRDYTLSVCDYEKRTHLHTFKGFGTEQLVSLEVTKNERLILITGQNGSLFVVDFGIPTHQYIIKTPHTKVIIVTKLTSDDKYLVTGADDGCIEIWDLEVRELLHTFEKVGESKEIWNFDISPDDNWIVSLCSDGDVDLWSLSDKIHVLTYERTENIEATSVIFAKDGVKVIVFFRDCSISIYNTHTGAIFTRIKSSHTDVVYTLDITSNSRYLVSGSADKSIEVWDLQKNKSLYLIDTAHDAMVWKVKITYNNKFILSSSSDGTIKLWDLMSKELIHTFTTSQKTEISALSITRDNTFAVAIDSDGTLEILNLKTRQQAYVNHELEGELCLSLCITSDNKRIILSRETDVYVLENPFNDLTIQHSLDCNPFTLMRFMPFTTYFFKKALHHRKEMITAYPQLMIHPQGWNWLHIAAIFSPNKEIIQSCFENKIPFTCDLIGKTPLHYLFENKKASIESINFILQKFDQILEQCQKPAALLKVLGDIFCKILTMDNRHVANFLRLCTTNTESESMAVVDIYGEIRSHEDIAFYQSNSIFYTPEIKDILVKDGYKTKLSIKVLPFYWDYSPTSNNMKLLVRTLKNLNYPGVFETQIVSRLTKYLWNSSKQLYYFLGFLFSVQAIFISVSVSVPGDYVGLHILILMLSTFFILYELVDILSHDMKTYFTSLWNYVDLAGHILILTAFIAVRAELDDNAKDWLFSFILVLVYIRWFSYFRVFKQTRKLIRMIIEVIKSIKSFGMVLVFVIFALSLIFLQFDRETPYSEHLLNSYLLLYSEFNVNDLGAGEIFYFIIVIALVSIILLNMLIAIIEDTFKEAQNRSVLVDSKELLDLIDETMNARRIFNCFKRKKTESEEDEHRKYLFYAEKTQEEDAFKQENEERQTKYLQECISEELQTFQTNINKQLKQVFDENIIAKIESQDKKIQEQNALILEQSRMLQEQGQLLQNLTRSIQALCPKSEPKPEVEDNSFQSLSSIINKGL